MGPNAHRSLTHLSQEASRRTAPPESGNPWGAYRRVSATTPFADCPCHLSSWRSRLARGWPGWALAATVARGGPALPCRTDIGETNGNAVTAAIVDAKALRLLMDAVHPACERYVAVVGATGSAVSRLLASDLSHLGIAAVAPTA